MNYLALRCATAVLLAGLSLTAAAQSASAPAQYGDYHAGNFGDIDQGHFGNAAAGLRNMLCWPVCVGTASTERTWPS
jgi:hypothetical protein